MGYVPCELVGAEPCTPPKFVHSAHHCWRHLYYIRPPTRESFRGPLRGRIYAHFGAKIRKATSMIERVYRSRNELDITLRIDIVQSFPAHFRYVLNIDILVDYHHALTEHRLPEPPNGMHYLTCLTRIRFPDRNK